MRQVSNFLNCTCIVHLSWCKFLYEEKLRNWLVGRYTNLHEVRRSKEITVNVQFWNTWPGPVSLLVSENFFDGAISWEEITVEISLYIVKRVEFKRTLCVILRLLQIVHCFWVSRECLHRRVLYVSARFNFSRARKHPQHTSNVRGLRISLLNCNLLAALPLWCSDAVANPR